MVQLVSVLCIYCYIANDLVITDETDNDGRVTNVLKLLHVRLDTTKQYFDQFQKGFKPMNVLNVLLLCCIWCSYIQMSKTFQGKLALTPYIITRDETAEFANSVVLDEVAHNEPPHLDLHCLPSSP